MWIPISPPHRHRCTSECPLRVVNLEPAPSLFCAPPRDRQGLSIIFLFIEDDCTIKVGLVAQMHGVGTRRALQPLRQLLLGTSLTQIAKDGSFLLITMFVLKDRGRLLASVAHAIPQVGISRKAFETPNQDPSW